MKIKQQLIKCIFALITMIACCHLKAETQSQSVKGGDTTKEAIFTATAPYTLTANRKGGWTFKTARVSGTGWTQPGDVDGGTSVSTGQVEGQIQQYPVELYGDMTPPSGGGGRGPINYKVTGYFAGEFSITPLKIYVWQEKEASDSFKSKIGNTDTLSFWSASPPWAGYTELRGDNNAGTSRISIGTSSNSTQWESSTAGEYIVTATQTSDQSKKANAELVIVGLTLSIPNENKIIMSPISMPSIRVTATILPENTNANIKTKFELSPPNYPDGSSYTSKNNIMSQEIEGNYWDIDFSGNIFGGNFKKIRVHLWIEEKSLGYKDFETDFHVVGDALYKNTRESYIDNATTSNNIRRMTKVIAIQESAGTHFWDGSSATKGATTHVRYPLKANDNGFGVMQLTSTNLLSVDSVWNWQTNINVGMQYIIQCYNAGFDYLNTGTITDKMRRLEGYTRYNGGTNARYHRWENGQWVKYNYISCPKTGAHASHGATHGYADYNFDGIPDSGYNVGYCKARAELYAEQCVAREN